MKEIVDKVIEELEKNVSLDLSGDKIKFSRPGYTGIEFSEDNFHKFNVADNDVKVGFVDGGNAEIFSGGNFSLQLVRVYGCVFLRNKKVDEVKNEFFVLIRAVGVGDIEYKCEIFSLNGERLVDVGDLKFSSVDETIKEGVFRGDISKIGNIVRRFSEIRLAEKVAELLDVGVVVLDGTLESNYTNERRYLDRLYEKAKEKGVVVCGLAKTTAMFTEKGNNVVGLLNNVGPDFMWWYHPVADISCEDHKADMFFVKLNDKSKYVFRFEVHNKGDYNIAEILGILVKNSKDLMFPGYPYGLITADKFARVSNKEKEYYKSIFIAKMGRKSENIAKYVSSGDAHSILDGRINS